MNCHHLLGTTASRAHRRPLLPARKCGDARRDRFDYTVGRADQRKSNKALVRSTGPIEEPTNLALPGGSLLGVCEGTPQLRAKESEVGRVGAIQISSRHRGDLAHSL